MVAIVNAERKVLNNVKASIKPAEITIAMCGVRNRGCVASRIRGSWRCSAIPYNTRGMAKMVAFIVPAVDRSAPRAIIIAPFGPRKRSAASASGRSEVANAGNTPIHTACTVT